MPVKNRSYIIVRDVNLEYRAAVKTATLFLVAYENRHYVRVNCTIYMVAADDAPEAPTNRRQLYDMGPLTTGVAWNAIENWIDGETYASPNLRVPLQEIVNRLGWEAGASIMLVIEDNGSDAGALRAFSSIRYNAGAEKPRLCVTKSGTLAVTTTTTAAPILTYYQLSYAGKDPGTGVAAHNRSTYYNDNEVQPGDILYCPGIGSSGYIRLLEYIESTNVMDSAGAPCGQTNYGVYNAKDGFEDSLIQLRSDLCPYLSGYGYRWWWHVYSYENVTAEEAGVLLPLPEINDPTKMSWERRNFATKISEDRLTAVNRMSFHTFPWLSTLGKTSGKHYAEMSIAALGLSYGSFIGLTQDNGWLDELEDAGSTADIGGSCYSVANSFVYAHTGEKGNNAALTAFGDAWTDGDIIGLAVDVSAGKVWFSRNGTWQGSGDPMAGTNPTFTFEPGTDPWHFFLGIANDSQMTARLQAVDFSYSPPVGFSAWVAA